MAQPEVVLDPDTPLAPLPSPGNSERPIVGPVAFHLQNTKEALLDFAVGDNEYVDDNKYWGGEKDNDDDGHFLNGPFRLDHSQLVEGKDEVWFVLQRDGLVVARARLTGSSTEREVVFTNKHNQIVMSRICALDVDDRLEPWITSGKEPSSTPGFKYGAPRMSELEIARSIEGARRPVPDVLRPCLLMDDWKKDRDRRQEDAMERGHRERDDQRADERADQRDDKMEEATATDPDRRQT